ncbi:hypothetical protein AALP_AA8G510100 [Arabis alpina]|uniref:Uncharacterized protein n=1 Tax=Arabis alpina TaxID=50452 RepID=A0A087GEU9_ARAAL|nr:hypothetical protein AALP_AA8G510100 [Arabis alpina]
MLMKRLVSFLIDSDLIVEESLNCCRGSEIDRWVWSRPDVKVYTMLVNGLAASLRVSDSLKIIRDICRVGISPAEEEDDALSARDAMDGKGLLGRPLRIGFSLEGVRGGPVVVPRFGKSKRDRERVFK